MTEIFFDAEFVEEAAALAKARQYHFDAPGMKAGFEAILQEFPLLWSGGVPIRVGRAYGFHEEGPRLIREELRPSIALRVQSRRFFNHGLLQTFLRHCFLKASDMIDPEFGYVPAADPGGRDAGEDGKIRECFEDLWGRSIADRLGYRGHRAAVGERASVVFFSSEPKGPAALRVSAAQEDLFLAARRMVRDGSGGR